MKMNYLLSILLLVLSLWLLNSIYQRRRHDLVDMDKLAQALIVRESGGDDGAIGHNQRGEPVAYGCLQITQPILDDYNKWCGRNVGLVDLLGHRPTSIKICKWYLYHYWNERTIEPPTVAILAAIWRSGPTGWAKSEHTQYIEQVQTIYDHLDQPIP